MKTRTRRLELPERQGELVGVVAIIEPVWEGDELDFFQWAREGGARVQLPTELISRRERGERLYGPPRLLERRALGETVVNPFLLKIFLYSEDPALEKEAVSRFTLAVLSAYNERKGADFAQPPWRDSSRPR
jgi:hypothetical protein